MRRGARKKSSPEKLKIHPHPAPKDITRSASSTDSSTSLLEPSVFRGLLIIFYVVAAFLFWKKPVPGFAVLGVAVVAAMMSVDQGMGRVRKAFGLLLVGIFAALEVRAISIDRNEQNKKFAQTLDTITGGDSYAFLSLKPLNQTPNTGNLILPFLIQRGPNPLYDLKIQLGPALVDNRGFIISSHYPSRDVAVGERTQLDQYPIRSAAQKMMMFTIYFDALNGHWAEQVGLRVVHGKWSEAIQVRKSLEDETTSRILYDYADPDYPKIGDQPDWSSNNSY